MSRRSVVITGCSSGFGKATALWLIARGWQVVATVRREVDRARLLEDARDHAPNLSVVIVDITRSNDVAALADAAGALAPALDGLVNNAGTAFPGPLELLPLEDFRAQLEVNVTGQLAVTQALLPLLKAGSGTIVNVSSVGGRLATPVLGAYNASKFALEAMSDVLRAELRPFGVRVVVIEPSSSPTEIWATSANRAGRSIANANEYAPLVARMRRVAEGAAKGFPPEQFAALVERVLTTPRPKARYAIPASAKGAMLMRRLMPDWLIDRMIRRLLKW